MTLLHHKTAINKMNIFVLCALFIHLAGGGYLYSKNLSKRLVVYKNSPIEATIELSPSNIDVSKDTTDEHTIHKTMLTATVTNHTKDTLTNVLLIIPSIGIGTLESISAKRVTNLPQQGGDDVFSMGKILSENTKNVNIWIYAREKKNYVIKAFIDTNEKFSITTNAVTLKVK